MITARIAAAGATLALAASSLFVAAAPASATTTCTYTQGYYKNHATGFRTGEFLPGLTDARSVIEGYFGKDLTAILQTPPKGGNADLIAAHQLIATAANGFSSTTTTATKTAYYGLLDYFRGTITLTRDQIIAYASELDAYNNGQRDLPHC